jgi:hypothetical protein
MKFDNPKVLRVPTKLILTEYLSVKIGLLTSMGRAKSEWLKAKESELNVIMCFVTGPHTGEKLINACNNLVT